MNENSNFTQGSILKKLLLFMLPILGALVLQSMYGAVDMLVVGQFGSTEGISGVSTGGNIINLIVCTVTAFSMGITVLIGRYIGEKKTEKLGKVIGGAIFIFILVAILLSVILIAFARPISMLMKAPVEAVDETIAYLRICGGGMIFIVAYNVISSIFRGLGNSKLPLLFVFIACVVNIIGDLILVAGFKMDVVGAAIATVTAQAVSVILSLVILRRQQLPFEIKPSDIGFNSEIRNFVKLGTPIAFQEFCTNLSFMALCAFINALGLAQSSGYGVGFKITSFMMLIPVAIVQSMSAFIAQNVGAQKEDRARQAMFTGMGLGLIVGVFVLIATLFWGDYMSMIFTKDAEVVAHSYAFLMGFAADVMLTSIMFSIVGYFNGHGQTKFVMFQGIFQTILVRLPISYFMSIRPGATLTGVGLAFPAATLVGMSINIVYLAIYTNKMKKNRLA
ncbi:MAG: MATE family efflux transporter [Firmicutes bacterium]|nr:MATE family efflux transporter [Bacillota bacterium]